MSESDAPAPADQPAPVTEPAAVPDGLLPNDPNGEGTTPQEVAQVLKSSGMDVPVDDAEEGDDPDAATETPAEPEAPAEPAEPAADEPEPAEEEPLKRTTPNEIPAEQPADEDKYGFEVTDANGVTFKIPVGAKMEDILKEFEPTNNGQVLDILNQLQKLDAQKTADEQAAQEEQATQARQARTDEILKGWTDEITALQASKRIPEGEDGDKRIVEVYQFLKDENDARIKAGRPTIGSFEDALDKLENKEARDKAAGADKTDREAARKNGSLVGGSSAASSNPAPVYKAGTAKNANQALRSMGLITD